MLENHAFLTLLSFDYRTFDKVCPLPSHRWRLLYARNKRLAAAVLIAAVSDVQVCKLCLHILY